jgi:mannose-6-phosphate isomerase-like protein (cupin superfamily)
VSDDRGFSNVIRGRGTPTPPSTDLGHFHTYGAEFWFVAEGQIDVQIEGVDELVSGFPGDIITAVRGRFHRASAGGTGMATRIATNGYPNGLHIYQTPGD